MEQTLTKRLGRPVDRRLADLGRLLWFDTVTGLNDDNSCGGCHSPTNGFGDTQSIAIGIDNNGIVGPHRTGPRNQRRTPIVINNVFYELPIEEVANYRERVQSITPDDIQRVAREYIRPDRLSMVLVGNAKAFVNSLGAVGFTEFDVIALDDLDLMSATLKKEPRAP
jgi:hypothetical protein